MKKERGEKAMYGITRRYSFMLALLVLTLAFCAMQPQNARAQDAEPSPSPPQDCPPCPGLHLPPPVRISEYRLRGPNGANDEFIELCNISSASVTVGTRDGSAGWALVASDGVPRFILPAGTVIPPYGHYLAVNALGYGLSNYPGSNSRNATGDTSYILDIPDGAGLALFETSSPDLFGDVLYRIDAVGYTTSPGMYREGYGIPSPGAEMFANLDYSFYRDLSQGTPKDTDDNAADFVGVNTSFFNTSAGQHLGAPGPENLSSPISDEMIGDIQVSLFDPTVPDTSAPNRVIDPTPDPANNAANGTLIVRRKITVAGDGPVTRLRFRIVDISTYPASGGAGDLRARSSPATIATLANGTAVVVQGTTLEQPPAQPNGGALNSSLTCTLSHPLTTGESVNVQFLLGIQQTGNYRFFFIVEALSS